ncbi:hypothetical protein HID58_031086 [Brassica napus]|uniref:RING-type domain-containing protein n=1 Tax=Brassica napus TaxID=3708 RepID=A0ABQ8CHS8_BRANA|nr:uncharacterized protein LOC106359413 [Brassica napus]KAH0916640.1 hypothetical protein HID58_031086 [Brassica napus]
MNLPSSTPATSETADSASYSTETCDYCGSQDSWVIHPARLRGVLRFFCTHCLLRSHPMSFCPTCLAFYDSSPPPHQSRRVSCSDCGSYTHIQCADGDDDAVYTHYLCPPCRDPISFSFFRPFVDTDGVPCLDKSLSEAFLCACKIAAFSMNRAVCAFKMEAERKGKEGAVEKKRACETLEYFVKLYEKARSDVDKLREASFEQYPAVQVKQEE